MGRPVLVDFDNLAKRSIMATALDDMKAGGTFTGGVYGTIRSLVTILNKIDYDPGPVYAFCDAGVSAFRRKLIPTYKATRKENNSKLTPEQKEKAYGQMATAREILQTVGVRFFAFKDREADDGVAAAAHVLRKKRPIIVSTDKDLLQCVSDEVHVHRQGKEAESTLVTPENFEAILGIPRHCWLCYRALVGDNSDEIDGAAGCGEKTAAKVIREAIEAGLMDCPPEEQLLDLTSYIIHTEKETGKPRLKWQAAICEGVDRLTDVIKGIDLSKSFGGTSGLAKMMEAPPTFDDREFLLKCRKLRFVSILGNLEGYLRPFRRAMQNV